MKATRRFCIRVALSAAFVSLCLASPSTSSLLFAQSVSFTGAESVLPASGLYFPTGVALDSAGDVFVADQNHNRVVELPRTATGYGPQMTLATSGLSYPSQLALDGAEDLFITDTNLTRVVELPKTGTGYGPQVTLPFTGLGYPGPVGVAIDSSGDVFVADFGNNRVVELPKTATGYGPQTTLPFDGLSFPFGVAVVSAGDVFVADEDNNRVVELPRTPTGFGPQMTLPFNGLNGPEGVAVDSVGDVFVADTFNNRVLELPKTPTGYGPQTTLPFNGLSEPVGVSLDSAGDLFIADSLSDRMLEVQTHSVNFGGANVCAPGATTPPPCSQTLTLTYHVNADATLGVPAVHTGGMPNLDFKLAGSGTTCVGAVTAGTTCTVNATFAPLAAGFRNGSVQITDRSGTLIAATLLSGFGIAATTGPSVAQLSTTYLPFGTIPFGTSKTLPLMVANIGGGTLTVTPSISGYSSPAPKNFSYTIASSTCKAGVTPGTSCTLVVEFNPPSIATHDNLLTLQTNASANPTVKLAGTVMGLSVFGGVSGAALNFGSVSSGSSEVLPLTITNVGLPGTVTVGTAIQSGPHATSPYTILTNAQNTCLAGIAAGQSCTLPVEFAPYSSGVHDDLLTLTPSAGGGSTTVWLIGSTP